MTHPYLVKLRRRFHTVDVIQSFFEQYALLNLRRSVIELNDVDELKKIFGWQAGPILDDPELHNFDYPEDANLRRIRDAESLGTVARNIQPKVCLDIGTSTGHSAALLAVNAPQSQVFTINIPPEEIIRGEGGRFTSIALEREKIGIYYRQQGLKNITQILSNTARWTPEIGDIDLAFIDGCHDTEFVFNDTRKVLACMQPGSFVVWHDFNLDLVEKFDWIYSVCLGVELLYRKRLISGRIYHIRDSWCGIYRVGN